MYKQQLLQNQPEAVQPQMQQEWENLTRDITRSLDLPNRERFMQRLGTFAQNVRDFARKEGS
jgi:hypothetical protein